MRFTIRYSLAVKLLLPSLIALIPMLLLFWWLGQSELNKTLSQKQADLVAKSSELNERFAYQIAQAEIALQTLAQSPILRKLERASCQERVEQHFRVLNHTLANLLVLSPQGKVVCNAKAPDKLHDLSERLYYQRAMQTQQFAIGNFSLGKTTQTHVIGMAFPFVEDQQVKMLTATSLEQLLARQLLLENGLRKALQRQNELVLYYQPQVRLDGTIRNFEALIRWQHPTLGMIMPIEFIPIAEQSSLIVNVGNWVLNTACQQLKAWLALGLQVDYISVNVSAMQLHVGDLCLEVEQAINHAGILPGQLELEITESFVMKYPEHAIAVLIQLKQLGVRLAMDDFGTGYSSLLYLKRLPLDCIKVDQGFVRDMLEDSHDASIVDAVVGLGHSFDLKVVAEGVETEAHAQKLRNLGCDFLQGYLFSRPVPAAVAQGFLLSNGDSQKT